jgi:hypothetical protein
MSVIDYLLKTQKIKRGEDKLDRTRCMRKQIPNRWINEGKRE